MLSHPFMYLLTLLPIFVILFHSCEGDVTVSPALACVGEQVRVQCSLNAPNGDMFLSTEIMFIVGNSDIPLLENDVNTGVGDPLNRLTAFGDISSSSTLRLIGSMNLSSFTSSDDGLRIGCSGRYQPGGVGSAVDFIETVNLTAAAPPSPPLSVSVSLTSLSAASCSGSVRVAWTPGDSDRPIDTYFLFLNGDSLTSVNSPLNSYAHSSVLATGVVYRYSVVASSCAGNSIPLNEASVSVQNYLLSQTTPLNLSYDQSNDMLATHWNLMPTPTEEDYPLLITYSLSINYSHSLLNATNHYTLITTFSLYPATTHYTLFITPHGFTTAAAILTTISVCIRITHQCGGAYGNDICRLYNAEYLPTFPTLPTTHITTHTTADTTHTTAIHTDPPDPVASSFTLILLIFILVIILISLLFLSILTILVVVIVYLLRKNKHLQSLSPPSQPPHPYEYIDLNTALTADTAATPSPHKDSAYYTAMHSAVSVSYQGAAPTYANLK